MATGFRHSRAVGAATLLLFIVGSITGSRAVLASRTSPPQPVPESESSPPPDDLLTPRVRRPDPADPEKVVRIHSWADYIDPQVLQKFSKETGIAVEYDKMRSNEQLDARLRAGHTGYDVVFPTGKFLPEQIKLGIYRKLDKSLLTNLFELDEDMLRKLAAFDPGNNYAASYQWGSSGLAYYAAAIKERMRDAPLDSFAMLWDPKVVSKFAPCGVAVLDAPSEVVATVLIYLGKDPNSEKPEDLAAAERVLMSVRPHIRMISSSDYVEALGSGELCLALAWLGDAQVAAARAAEGRQPALLSYQLPKEGAVIFFDTMAIPADAPHVKNAHLFIDYLLRADIAVKNSEYTGFAHANAGARQLLGWTVAHDKNISPPADMRQRLVTDNPKSADHLLRLERVWARFRKG